MSSASHLRAQVRAALATRARVLVVGAKGVGLPGAHEISAPEAILKGRWDGIAWFARDNVRAGLVRLRAALAPAGTLVLAVEPPGLTQQLWGTLSGTGTAMPVLLEEACEALVMAGLLTPRVIVAEKRGFALSAYAPVRPEPLDAFFEQPPG